MLGVLVFLRLDADVHPAQPELAVRLALALRLLGGERARGRGGARRHGRVDLARRARVEKRHGLLVQRRGDGRARDARRGAEELDAHNGAMLRSARGVGRKRALFYAGGVRAAGTFGKRLVPHRDDTRALRGDARVAGRQRSRLFGVGDGAVKRRRGGVRERATQSGVRGVRVDDQRRFRDSSGFLRVP